MSNLPRRTYKPVPRLVRHARTPVDRVLALIDGDVQALADMMGLSYPSIYRLRAPVSQRGNDGFFCDHHLPGLREALSARFGSLPDGFLTEAGLFPDPRERRSPVSSGGASGPATPRTGSDARSGLRTAKAAREGSQSALQPLADRAFHPQPTETTHE